jgi:hypothetical protein
LGAPPPPTAIIRAGLINIFIACALPIHARHLGAGRLFGVVNEKAAGTNRQAASDAGDAPPLARRHWQDSAERQSSGGRCLSRGSAADLRAPHSIEPAMSIDFLIIDSRPAQPGGWALSASAAALLV